MRFDAVLLAVVFCGCCATIVTAISCNVRDGSGESGAFRCETDDDCVDGYTCAPNRNNIKVCFDDPPENLCRDGDGDGWGVGADRTACPACQKDKPRGCEKDCDDGNPDVHPGALEKCSKDVDEDCDGETDERLGTNSCDSGDAQLSECRLEEPAQDGTEFDCATVGGTPQCVVKGRHRRGKSKCQRRAGWGVGVCEGDTRKWEEIDSCCTNSDESCD